MVVNKSTVPIGSGNWVGALVREAYEKKNGKKANGAFAVASNPEFLREGSAILDSLYPDRVVIGADQQRTSEVLYSLYRPILDQTFKAPSYMPRPEGLGAVPLISADLASAELIKYAANAFLALKISYINEIGQLAEKVGADIGQVAKGIGLDARIGIHSGPVVAGVIGMNKFAFDLWGDTVNVASRMESTGIPGEIQLSIATRELLPPNFITHIRGHVAMKGHSSIETFLLRGR